MGKVLTRRSFLITLGASSMLTACKTMPLKSGFLGTMERWNEWTERLLFDPNRLAPELPPDAATPMKNFPAYFISDEMPISPAGWMLKVGGMVARPGLFSLDDLRHMPRTEMRVRHHCVEGWSAVASWQGVRVSDLAAFVGADPRASYVEFRSFDANYWSSWDRPSAMHKQTIVAYGMNGYALGPGHGAPLRLYSAVKLGYKMVKYLSEVNFLDHRTGGYWEDRGYQWFAGV